jgi:hypothetical protein
MQAQMHPTQREPDRVPLTVWNKSLYGLISEFEVTRLSVRYESTNFQAMNQLGYGFDVRKDAISFSGHRNLLSLRQARLAVISGEFFIHVLCFGRDANHDSKTTFS